MSEPSVILIVNKHGDTTSGLKMASRLARDRSATLLIVEVIPLVSEDGEAMLLAAMDLFGSDSRAFLDSLTPPDPSVPYMYLQEVGDPEEQIVALAAKQKAELIVMEATAASWLSRALRRSLHARLVTRCACPIVTYHGQKQRIKGVRRRPSKPIKVSPDVLTAILSARVEALVAWLRARESASRHAAKQPSIKDAIASLHRGRANGHLFSEQIRNMLTVELAEYQRAWKAIGVTVLIDDEPLLQLGVGARESEAYSEYLAQLQQKGSAVSRPLSANRTTPQNRVVLAGAALRNLDAASLIFSYDARTDFLRILAQPGPAPSFETYAFDRRGVMLSNTRFPQQLRDLGILPDDGATQASGVVHVRDPGGNLLTGNGVLGPNAPLTRAAASATKGEDGCDFVGYRDYRGVEVIGVWRWLEEFGFAVTAEIDRSSPNSN